MGIVTKGRPARDYTNNRKKIMCKLYEGNLNYNPNGIGRDGRTVEQYSVTDPMHIGQLVEIHEDSTAEHIIVKPAAEGSQQIVGKVIFDPRLRWTPDWEGEARNRLPKENKPWGEYSPRSATVEFFADAVDEIDLIAENAEIAPYDDITYSDNNQFDKADGTTNLISLCNVDANRGGKLVVLADYYFYGATKE